MIPVAAIGDTLHVKVKGEKETRPGMILAGVEKDHVYFLTCTFKGKEVAVIPRDEIISTHIMSGSDIAGVRDPFSRKLPMETGSIFDRYVKWHSETCHINAIDIMTIGDSRNNESGRTTIAEVVKMVHELFPGVNLENLELCWGEKHPGTLVVRRQ